ncbi:MAG: SusC/RagA family TonB-linked outer membrane protein [Prevotella sp.]|nr:SusC/RagA family TonB-linked outer membrane protein [Prevotella sp.]
MKRHIAIFLSCLFIPVGTAVAQEYVTGRVTDATTRQPLQGVSVASGPGISVLTDSNGVYRVPVVSFDGRLQFSNPGRVSREAPLQGRQTLDVVLYSNAFESLKDGEGSLSSTNSMSFDEGMAARYGGDIRVIQRSNMAGVGANLFIRGYHSLNLNSQPLIVIDGVIQNTEYVESVFQGFYINPLSNIDCNDIEKVVVLKNATAIYGSKGANGALIITTKRGKSVSTKIDVNISCGFDFKPRLPRMLSADQFRSYASEMLKGTVSGLAAADKSEGFLNDEPDLSKNISYNTYHNNHDWTDDVYRVGNHQYYGLNVEGGDDIAKYALSVSYMMGKGQIKETDYDRLSTHFNADVLLSKRITLAAGFDFTYITRQLVDAGVNEYTSAPYLALIKSPLLTPYQYTRDGREYTTKLSDVDVFGISNPTSLLTDVVNKYTQYRFGANIMPRWAVTDNLDLSLRLAYNMNAVKEHYYSPLEGVAPQTDAAGNVWENTVKDQSINQGSFFIDGRVHFHKLFGGIHGLDAAIGYRMQKNVYKSNYGEGHNTGSDKVVNLSASLDGKMVDGRKTTVNNVALYAQASYNYLDKYSVWGVLTAESCSTFGKKADGGLKMFDGVWGVFPSVGASWNIASERFFKPVTFIDDMKLRVEYGLSGNDALNAVNRFSYLQAINYFGVANGLQIGNLDNQKQKWETTSKFNVGLDLTMLNDRLSLSFDYFHHKTTDLLMLSDADLLTGISSRLTNGGSMTNNGFEVSVNARLLNLRKLKWNSELGLSHYKNKLTSLPGGSQILNVAGGSILLQEGSSVGTFYGYRTESVFATEEEAVASGLRTWNTTKSQLLDYHAGDVHFVDLDGNSIIDEDDRTVIGNANPDITGSWGNRLSYGPFTLDVLFSFSFGADVYNYQRHMLESMTNLQNQSAAVANRWKYEGQQTSIPRAVYGDPMRNSRFSDRFIESASYVKLKEVRLSYQFQLPWHFISGGLAWISVGNLCTWTRYLGSDPEVSYGTSPLTQGIDYGVSPLSRNMQIGLKLNL